VDPFDEARTFAANPTSVGGRVWVAVKGDHPSAFGFSQERAGVGAIPGASRFNHGAQNNLPQTASKAFDFFGLDPF
jgi:hypothetical protein